MKATKATLDRSNAATGGMVAGLVGGAVIAILMTIVSIAQGHDIWPGMKMAGAPFLGERAFAPGFDLVPVVVGVLSHFAVSMAWGLLFGLLFYGASNRATVGLGALWGVVVWLGMYYVVLPVVGLAEVAGEAPVGLSVLEHVAFGLTLGMAFLPFQRTRRKEAARAVRREPLPH